MELAPHLFSKDLNIASLEYHGLMLSFNEPVHVECRTCTRTHRRVAGLEYSQSQMWKSFDFRCGDMCQQVFNFDLSCHQPPSQSSHRTCYNLRLQWPWHRTCHKQFVSLAQLNVTMELAPHLFSKDLNIASLEYHGLMLSFNEPVHVECRTCTRTHRRVAGLEYSQSQMWKSFDFRCGDMCQQVFNFDLSCHQPPSQSSHRTCYNLRSQWPCSDLQKLTVPL